MNPQTQPPVATPSPTPTPAPSSLPTPATNTGVKGVIWTVLAVVLSIIAVALIALSIYMYSSGKTLSQLMGKSATPESGSDEGDDASGDSDSEENDDAEDEELELFTGDYFTGEHPGGWIITEYVDGAGSDMLVEGAEYFGVTGITIDNPDGDTVFTLGAVMGIGGTEECTEYYQFSDSNQAYYNSIVAINTGLGSAAPTIVNLAGKSYTDVTLFGKALRRVETDLFWDVNPNSAGFDAACGISYAFFELPGLSFLYDEESSHTYQAQIALGTPEDELLILDSILSSLVVTAQ